MTTTFPKRVTGVASKLRPSTGVQSFALAGGVALAAPLLAFAFLLAFPQFDVTIGSRTGHFYIVSVVALLSLAMAIATLFAARSVSDSRTFFLAMGFTSLAAIFSAHGLGTSPFFHSHPDPAAAFSLYGGGGGGLTEEVARLKVVAYSAILSLVVSAAFFAMATVDLPERWDARIHRHRLALVALFTVAVSGHVFVALWHPFAIAWIPMDREPLNYTIGVASTAMLCFAAYRFWQAFRIAMLPLQGAMAVAMLFLVEAQWFMLLGDLWRLSWWEYHIVMLAGFLIGAGSLLYQRRITGDLGAIVEGLFLRRQVVGLRHGDPKALGALGAAVAAKDTETAGHIERVGDLAVDIGQRLRLPTDQLEALRWAGRLHDVGKIGVPNALLRKPGKLTPEEFEIMKQHTVRGWHIANQSEVLKAVAPIIRAHHERMDGRGYPDAMPGALIPIEARIVAAADVWDALTSDRPYRAGMPAANAAEILVNDAGEHLDPACIAELFRSLDLQHPLRELEARIRDFEREAHRRAA